MKIYRLNGEVLEAEGKDIWVTERSRNEEICDRHRWNRYYEGESGRGLVSRLEGEDLRFGSSVHDGLDKLYEGATPEEAAEIAKMRLLGAKDELIIQDNEKLAELMPEVAELLVEEQAYLAYLLVYAFGYRNMDQIKKRFRVVSKEEEINWLADEGGGTRKHVVVMSRPDQVLEDIVTGKYYVTSYKTSKMLGDGTLEELMTQNQNFSEGYAVWAKYQKELGGTAYFFLLKGEKRFEKSLGVKRYNNYLIRPYMNIQLASQGGALTPNMFRLEYTKLKGWERVDIWKVMDFQEWLGWLGDGLIDGQDHLRLSVSSPAIVPWDDRHANRWLVGAVKRERTFELGHDMVKEGIGEFDYWMGTEQKGCVNKYGKTCLYFDSCWKDRRLDIQVMEERLVVRTPNHPQEEEVLDAMEEQ